MTDTVYLTLENGCVFQGKSFGARGEAVGEIVFSTGMTGYLETLTDPSYFGQIIVQTFPLIGNYGVIPSDFESTSIRANAYIVKSWCRDPSNFRSEGNLDTFLKSQGIVGLCGIDTRALTKIIRENGVMNGTITSQPQAADLAKTRAYRIENALEAVSTKAIKHDRGENGRYRVALLDYGSKNSTKQELLRRGCEIWTFPHDSTADRITQIQPDGILLSNGPGDPAENVELIRNLRGIIDLKVPVFGIGLGHQLLALAHGFQTTKLKYGHHGANQPVQDLLTGRVYITSQNHGYNVVAESVDLAQAQIFFQNLNDKTCEGLIYKNAPLFSVQFEACGSPHETMFLFERFTEQMEGYKHAAR